MSRCWHPLRGVGAVVVPPRRSHLLSVVFVCARDRDGKIVPIGTAFLVGLPPVTPIQYPPYRYLVTAGHVVQDVPETWIRFRRVDGSKEDLPVSKWIRHPKSDLAATPCEFDTSLYLVDWQDSEEAFIDHHPLMSANVGDRTFFVGLLTQAPTMHDRVIPFARAGSIGATYVEDLPTVDNVRGVQVRTTEPVAHLVDCYSREGFSGSPMFVEQPRAVVVHGGSLVHLTTEIGLLGVTIGHFGGGANNAGIAIVVPVEAVRELLDQEELVEWRVQKGASMEAGGDQNPDDAAVLDSARDPDGESTPSRLSLDGVDPEDALRALLRTPSHAQTEDPA